MAPTIDLVYFDAGGGHRAAAQALQAGIALQRRPWRVRLVHLFDALDPQGRFRKVTGMAPEAYYNKRLAHGLTFGLAQELKILQGLIRLGHGTMVRQLQAHWAVDPPDLVVSLLPNFNRALCAASTVPFVTVLTDIADLPPSFWIEPGQEQHLVCGSARAVEQALAAGLARERVHATSGMILRPAFYEPPLPDRAGQRAALGLPATEPVGVVMFGGQGSRVMRSIAKALPELPLILLCGHNEALRAALQSLPAKAPRVLVGHTAEVARYLRLADFFVGKPGPGSLSEALHCGLPVIVTRNAATMPQERYNTDWVLEQGVGRVLPSFAGIAAAVQGLLADLPALRARVARLDNRALFEVITLFERLLAATPSRACSMAVTAAS